MLNNKEKFIEEVNHFVDHSLRCLQNIKIDENIYMAVKKISECEGIIITTGMGKNNHIARKTSSTLSSLKIPSCFIHPGDASHGDSGIIRDKDILLVFSTSGKTDEVIKTINTARDLGISLIISITSHMDSPIRKMSDIVLDIGEIKEAGHLGLAPTTSTMAMLMVGDILATFSAKDKGVTIIDFNMRHHSGYLGLKSSSHL